MELNDDFRSATLVAIDKALGRGGYREVTPGEVLWVLESAQNWVHYYDFEHELAPDGSVFGINASSYDNWLTSSASAPLSVAAMDRIWREMMHTNCPLFRCEDFNMRQKSWPVSRDSERPMILIGTPGGMSMWQPGDWVQLYRGGEDLVPIGTRITEVDRARGRITLAADLAQLGVIEPREVRQVLDPAPLPKSRVPAHVQQHRRRLDGRRR